MNPEIKKIWVDALRSGEYGQGEGRLYDGESFCCLGVLCDLHQKMTGNGIWTHAEDEDGNSWVVYQISKEYNSGEILPTVVREWAGLNCCNPETRAYGAANGTTVTNIAQLNDNGFSFEEISKIIEEDL